MLQACGAARVELESLGEGTGSHDEPTAPDRVNHLEDSPTSEPPNFVARRPSGLGLATNLAKDVASCCGVSGEGPRPREKKWCSAG